MNIVMVAINDPAGTGIEFCRALRRYTDHECRLVTTEIRYNFLFEKDLHVPWLKTYDELEQVLRKADLFHFHMTADEHTALGPFTISQFLAGQPIVHHHHGEPPFRADPRSFAVSEIRRGRRALVSTPDLLRGYPEATWLPNIVPLDDPLYCPVAREDRSEIVVGHSPTRKDLKNTTEFVAAVNEVRRDHPELRPRIIENTEHRICLDLKRSCDITFDHMQGYFGVSSLESLSQGVPVIAGVDAWNLRHICEFTGKTQHPWVIARDKHELVRQLRLLAADAQFRRALGANSRKWMEENWTPKIIARRLADFYGQVTAAWRH